MKKIKTLASMKLKTSTALLFIILAVIIASGTFWSDLKKLVNKSSTSSINGEIEFGLCVPPFANQGQIDKSLMAMDDLNVKLFRTPEWWQKREPSKGNYDWGPMDTRMKAVKDNDLKVLITLMMGEPRDGFTPQDFGKFVGEMVKRYPGIHAIQFENEWDSQGAGFWTGTTEELIVYNNAAYDAVKAHSPSTHFVLGGITRGPANAALTCENGEPYREVYSGKTYSQAQVDAFCRDQYPASKARILSVFNNAKYDVVDIHLYDDPERWHKYIDVLKQITDKPLITTELGGPNLIWQSCPTCPNPYTDEYHAQVTKEYIQTAAELGIKEAYYFKLVEGGDASPAHAKSALVDEDLQLKPAYNVFKNLINNR